MLQKDAYLSCHTIANLQVTNLQVSYLDGGAPLRASLRQVAWVGWLSMVSLSTGLRGASGIITGTDTAFIIEDDAAFCSALCVLQFSRPKN